MNKFREITGRIAQSRSAQLAIGGGVVAGAGMVASVAGATGSYYDPTSGLTTFATSVGTQAGPIVLVVATALIGLSLLFWGVKFAYSFIGRRIHG